MRITQSNLSFRGRPEDFKVVTKGKESEITPEDKEDLKIANEKIEQMKKEFLAHRGSDGDKFTVNIEFDPAREAFDACDCSYPYSTIYGQYSFLKPRIRTIATNIITKYDTTSSYRYRNPDLKNADEVLDFLRENLNAPKEEPKEVKQEKVKPVPVSDKKDNRVLSFFQNCLTRLKQN